MWVFPTSNSAHPHFVVINNSENDNKLYFWSSVEGRRLRAEDVFLTRRRENKARRRAWEALYLNNDKKNMSWKYWLHVKSHIVSIIIPWK